MNLDLTIIWRCTANPYLGHSELGGKFLDQLLFNSGLVVVKIGNRYDEPIIVFRGGCLRIGCNLSRVIVTGGAAHEIRVTYTFRAGDVWPHVIVDTTREHQVVHVPQGQTAANGDHVQRINAGHIGRL